jgi:hypothetical protein
MDALGFDGDVALGIEIELQGAAGGKVIHQLDTTDFHNPVTSPGSKPWFRYRKQSHARILVPYIGQDHSHLIAGVIQALVGHTR